MANPVQILSLGCGWTGSFLLPQLEKLGYSYWFTTTSEPPQPPSTATATAVPGAEAAGPTPAPSLSGPPPKFNPWPYLPLSAWNKHTVLRLPEGCDDHEWSDRLKKLPPAQVVLIVFPIRDPTVLHKLVQSYEQLHPDINPSWVLLGSNGLWKDGYCTSSTPIDPTNVRGQVEDALLALQTLKRSTAVLDLAGLYGHTRKPINFLRRVAPTAEALERKESLHLVHGKDVARAVIALLNTRSVWGQRWIVTDTRTYDWWLLARTLTTHESKEEQDKFASWVDEIQARHDVASLPRPPITPGATVPPPGSPERYQLLARVLDGSEFWKAIGSSPTTPPLDGKTI